MRKLMLMAAMLAMVLVAAVPAFAQDATAGDGGTATGGDSTVTTTDTQYQNQAAAIIQDCRTIVGQYGDATGGDNSVNSIGVQVTGAQCQAIINQVQAGDDAVSAVNAVLGAGTVAGVTGGDVVKNGVDDDADGVVDDADETAAVSGGAAAGGAAAGTSVLPDTGGASLFTLGAGALLVGGGLLARRIFR